MENDCGFLNSKMGDGKSKVESQDLDFQKLNLKKRSDFDKAKPRKCTALCVFLRVAAPSSRSSSGNLGLQLANSLSHKNWGIRNDPSQQE